MKGTVSPLILREYYVVSGDVFVLLLLYDIVPWTFDPGK